MRTGARVLTTLVVAGGMLAWGSCWGQLLQEKKYGEYAEEEKNWTELETALPEYPKPENLIRFYVSAVASNVYLVDAKTLSVGADGVVRYVLVVKTPGGATNVSFEGMRCKTKERRLYALGRGETAWTRARGKDWSDIQPGSHQNVLYKEYFCPNGVPIFRAEEGADALRRGGNLRAKQNMP